MGKNNELIKINKESKDFLKKLSSEIISPIEGKQVPISELNRRHIELSRKNPMVLDMLKRDAEMRRKLKL